jgi:hypothetical protein
MLELFKNMHRKTISESELSDAPPPRKPEQEN